MKNKITYIALGIIVCIFTFSVVTLNSNLNESTVVTSVAVLSDKKIGWGIKRAQNYEQPDLGSNNVKLIKEYDGISMGNNEDRFVYLTFDNGYEAGYTLKILDVLKENNVKAAFFITAHYLNTTPELVERMINEGHIVGNQFTTSVMYHI